MKIHEYQAKELLSRYGVKIPRGRMVTSAEAAEDAAVELGGLVVVKAQIHAGGRGKGGGIVVAKDHDEAHAAAKRLLGKPLVTHQTGPAGRIVRRLLIEEGLSIARELYLGLVVDRELGRVTLILSGEGGMEIEEVARLHPEKILKAVIHPLTGLMPNQVRKIAYDLGLTKAQVDKVSGFALGMFQAFMDVDASLIEINPLVITTTDSLVALDAKVDLDENALFRHIDLIGLRDPHEDDPAEVEASKHNLSYVRLDGNIGCMVNGAGLAMATMDIIKLYGGEPANFLDVGGGTDQARVKAAFEIILSDSSVRAVLVNIFGGIVRCDVIAQGVVAAIQEMGIHVPLVVRLHGTKVDEGEKILASSGLNIISADGMAEAAEAAVQAARRRS